VQQQITGHAASSLYVTACDAVYRIRLKVPGVMAGPALNRPVR